MPKYLKISLFVILFLSTFVFAGKAWATKGDDSCLTKAKSQGSAAGVCVLSTGCNSPQVMTDATSDCKTELPTNAKTGDYMVCCLDAWNCKTPNKCADTCTTGGDSGKCPGTQKCCPPAQPSSSTGTTGSGGANRRPVLGPEGTGALKVELGGIQQGILGSTEKPTAKDIAKFIGQIVQSILSAIGAFALLMVVYGGILILTSHGNPEGISKGKKTITWAFIGVGVVLGSYALVSYVITGIEGGGGGGGGGQGGQSGSGTACSDLHAGNFQCILASNPNKQCDQWGTDWSQDSLSTSCGNDTTAICCYSLTAAGGAKGQAQAVSGDNCFSSSTPCFCPGTSETYKCMSNVCAGNYSTCRDAYTGVQTEQPSSSNTGESCTTACRKLTTTP